MTKYTGISMLFLVLSAMVTLHAQTKTVQDDFEGQGTIKSWFGDDCTISTAFANPFQQGENTSATVLKYHDTGGQYANVRFDVTENFKLDEKHTFFIKIYISSSQFVGNATNQVSLKLQNGTAGEPWTTQCEIIKPVTMDQWQTLSFDFANDVYKNFDVNSATPVSRTDFNRVLIQINGEGNSDQVVAYIDDVYYDGTLPADPVFNNLVWNDEFDENGAVNSEKWFHQTQLPAGGGWYNGEVQHYTNRTDNAYVEDGILNIVAKRESYTNQNVTKNFTSARLNSKFAFKYGKLEIRAKLPSGVGTWPALWTLGKNINENGAYWDNQGFGTAGWPACGEMDMMEHWGSNQNYVQSAMHTPSSYGGTVNKGGQVIETASTDFHVYAMLWTADKIVFSVDGKVHYTYNPPVKDENTWPFDAEQYILMNIAIEPGIAASFTQSAMEIDYVRIYQEGNATSVENTTELNPIRLYPNPVENVLNVEFPEKNGMIRIYSASGVLIDCIHSNLHRESYNMEALQKGLYILEVSSGTSVNTFKVMHK